MEEGSKNNSPKNKSPKKSSQDKSPSSDSSLQIISKPEEVILKPKATFEQNMRSLSSSCNNSQAKEIN